MCINLLEGKFSGGGTPKCGKETLDGLITADKLVYGMAYEETTGAWYFAIGNNVSKHTVQLVYIFNYK